MELFYRMLYYRDLKILIEDIKIQPNAATIADFILYWSTQFYGPVGEGFFFLLLDLVNEHEPKPLTKAEVDKVNNWDLNDYRKSKNPQLRFSKAYVCQLINNDDFDVSEILSRMTIVNAKKQPKKPSFKCPTRYKVSLVNTVKALNTVTAFLPDEDAFNNFIKVFLAHDLREDEFKGLSISFANNTQDACYILYRLSETYTQKKPHKNVFDRKIFRSDNNTAITQSHASKAYGVAKETDFDHKSRIDTILNDANPYKSFKS